MTEIPYNTIDLMDIGVLLLDPTLRVRFYNRRFAAMWSVRPDQLGPNPAFRDLLACAEPNSWHIAWAPETPWASRGQENAVRAGPVPPTQINFDDGRRLLFSCAVGPHGGRVLTYTDISLVLRREIEEAIDHVAADLRFNTETMENQAAYLASLAEATDENAHKAEAARLALEHEVAERRALEARLREMATIDGLTGILNRAAFLAAGQTMLEQTRGLDQDLALFMIDIDHFKAINDRYGHAGGDHALKHLVATLLGGIRRDDLLGRLGGEEFAILLPATAPETAELVGKRLVDRVAANPTDYGDRPIRMTVSIGLAAALEIEQSIEQTIARADAALYRAKNNGRNRLVTDQQACAAWISA